MRPHARWVLGPVRTGTPSATPSSWSSQCAGCVSSMPKLSSANRHHRARCGDPRAHNCRDWLQCRPMVLNGSPRGRGLKILVFAVQSCPCPPVFSASWPPLKFSPDRDCAQIVPIAGSLQLTRAHILGGSLLFRLTFPISFPSCYLPTFVDTFPLDVKLSALYRVGRGRRKEYHT